MCLYERLSPPARLHSLARQRDGLMLVDADLNLCRQTKDKWGFQMTARYEMYAGESHS